MIHRRHPLRFRRYIYTPPEPPADNTYKDFSMPDPAPLMGSFPLPKLEEEQEEARRKPPVNTFPVFDIFKQYHDEIILIGLIFILMQEGVQDEFLIIILVYLLLSGRD